MPRRRVQLSTTTTPKPSKPSVLPLPGDPEALLERFKDFPAIDVIERRFSNPSDPGSLPILLKDEAQGSCINSEHQNRLKPGSAKCHLCLKPARKWFVYWVNTGQEGRWGQIKSKGYVPVEVNELQDAQDVSDLVKQAEESGQIYVRRGDRGQEILCKQPLELFNEIKRRQRAIRDSKANSAKARREERAEAAGTALGDEAGQSMYDGAIKEEYMRTSRSSLADEAEATDLD